MPPQPGGPAADTWGCSWPTRPPPASARSSGRCGRPRRRGGSASDGPVRLLFLDGLHDFENVLDNATRWQAHLTRNAVVVFDDAQFDGVRRAVTAARRQGLLPPGQVTVDNASMCGIAGDRALCRYLLPRLHPPAAGPPARRRRRVDAS
jgi:hypothetical protein